MPSLCKIERLHRKIETAFNNVTVMAVMGAIGLKVALANIETTFGTKMINLPKRKRAHR